MAADATPSCQRRQRRYPRSVEHAVPRHLLLAAGPRAPGVDALLARFAAGPGPRRILLSGAGLAWAQGADLGAAGDGAEVAVCSRHARDAGWRLETAPAGVRWTSVGRWLAELDDVGAALWVALP
jgi:hypothetical protein